MPAEALNSGAYLYDVYGVLRAVVEASAENHVYVTGYLCGGEVLGGSEWEDLGEWKDGAFR